MTTTADPTAQVAPASRADGEDAGHDPRTGRPLGGVPHSSPAEVDAAVAAAVAAADPAAAASPAERRAWLGALADALDRHADELVATADAETALGTTRLTGEVARMSGQLRFYADVAVEGSYLGAALDRPVPDRAGVGPLARVHVPLGPVAVFGASNFPFAFGVLGNDTASALAAGCPVVTKTHPAHPLLSRRLVEVARTALAAAGGPEGLLGSVVGLDAGARLVRHPGVRAVAFTGSQRGGTALWRMANQREVVVPVYAEMGTVNPVVVTPGAAGRMAQVAAGFVGSFTLGHGQFCTKPGLMLGPAGSAGAVAAALAAASPEPVMLTEAVADGVRAGLARLEAAGASLVARRGGEGPGWSAPAAVLTAPLSALTPGSDLLEECFGPVALVAEYDDLGAALDTVDRLQNALAASAFLGDPAGADPDAARVLDRLQRKVGRVVVDDWPTGVAFTWAQHHGGPWPATSNPQVTSVGAAALGRFVRPVAFQGVPDALLPPALAPDNPWRLPRRVDGVLTAPEPAVGESP